LIVLIESNWNLNSKTKKRRNWYSGKRQVKDSYPYLPGFFLQIPLLLPDRFTRDGPSIATLKGKMTSKRTPGSSRSRILSTSPPTEQTLHSDVGHVNSHLFLISVARPLGLTISTKVKSLKTADIKAAFKNQINLLSVKNFKVTDVNTDGAFAPLTQWFQSKSINLKIVGGTHVALVERKINRIRSIMFSLKFMMPESWIPYLVFCMVITSNSINSTTPWENFMGRKMNYQVDLKTFFGQYVQAHQPLIDNSMTARTSARIAMVSTGNERGTVIFFDLNSKKFVHRDRWTEVALTQEIIERVNSLAMSEKIKPSTNQLN
jgi:hypothetical protein